MKVIWGIFFGCNIVAHINDSAKNDVNMASLPNKTATSMTQTKIDHKSQLELIHARLGHPSLSKMRHVNAEYCKGITEYNCGVCYNAKHHKFPFTVNNPRALECFELIHLDLWGAYRVKNLDGSSYFLTVLDDHSRVTWTFLLHNKLQVERIVKEFLLMVETQFSKKIRRIRTYNGTEIVKESCRQLFALRGMKRVFHMFLN